MVSNRRVDIKKILSEPDLRRKLMVETIQATQAREGIETTEEQANKAYYIVTEAEQSSFFGLRSFRGSKDAPDAREVMFCKAIQGSAKGVRFDIRRSDFRSLVYSPLAYEWVYILGPIFHDNVPLDPSYADARQGLISTEAERFVRYHWEVSNSAMKHWVPYAKGGDFSRFYSDLNLVFDWTDNGAEIKSIAAERYGSASRTVKCEEYYFRPGITWVEKTVKGMNARILPGGAIFNVAGPSAFPKKEGQTHYLLGILNSNLVQACLLCFSTRSWGAQYVGKVPIATPDSLHEKVIAEHAATIHDAKSWWDEGNEVSTRFSEPWLLRSDVTDATSPVSQRLAGLSSAEAELTRKVQGRYAELNYEVYRLYGVTDKTRERIENYLGQRPTEDIWPQMENKDADQKRMEHVYRLLSYIVKRVVENDQDGIVPFISISNDTSLVDRVHEQLEALFPQQQIAQVESQIVNELKKRVRGFKRVESISQWLENIFFDYHSALYEKRPVIWHIASKTVGSGTAAFGVFVNYHKFDKNCMAKLRGSYVRDAIGLCRREAGLAFKEGRNEDQVEWQARLEEIADLDERLRLIQEGHHEGKNEGENDFRILTPWKSVDKRPKGWDPDIDDGVKVNIQPLQKARVLRVQKVV